MGWEIAAAIAFIGIPAIFAWISFSLDEKHIFLKLLLFFSSFAMFILGINLVKAATTDTNVIGSVNALYLIFIILSFMVFIYFFIFFIIRAINIKKEKVEEGE